MFERIVLRRSLDGPLISAGEIAEALLYYQNVHLVLDYSSFIGLLKKIGMRTLLRVISLPDVKCTYIEETTGTHTEQTPVGPIYSLTAFRVVGHQDVGQLDSKKKRLEYVLDRHGYSKSECKRLAERFRQMVHYKNITDDYYVKGGIIQAAQLDLLDTDYVAMASRIASQELLGSHSLPQDFYFEVRLLGNRFQVDTNLDFDLISKIQQAIDPNAGEYTPAHITSALLNASSGMVMAGHYGGDFYTSDAESKIIELRQKILFQRFRRDQEELGKFKEVALHGCPSIADAVNNGDRTIDEFLELLSAARKFKAWLKSKSPDESLLTAYVEDINSIGWLSRLSGKTIRYGLGLAAGALDPVIAAAISAADTFLLDRIVAGWRPNQFISKKVRPFVLTKDDDL